MPIAVNKDKCTACETCLISCPFEAIVMREGKAFINEYCNQCKVCLSVCPEGAIVEVEEISQFTVHSPQFTDYKDVLVFAEQRNGKVASVSYELLGIGRKLSNELRTKLLAILLGSDESEARELIKWGADKVYLYNDPIFSQFNDDTYTEAVSKFIKENKPAIVLAGATPVGRSFIPRVAARLRTGLTAGFTAPEKDEGTKKTPQARAA